MARANGYTLFLTANDAVFSLHSPSTSRDRSTKQLNPKDSTSVVRMQLVGGNALAKVAATNQLPGASNYFLGNDPGRWRTNVPRYARVSYQDVYPGVNLAFHGAQRQLEFDFLVAPRANPEAIDFHFTGAQGLKTDDSGNLIVSSAAGNVVLHKPVAYQEQNGTRQTVDARFAVKANNQVSFELGNYDRSRELVIDPSVSIAYATYLGGSLEDDGYGIAIDSTGNAYVTGQTASANFPVLGGVVPNTFAGIFDVFVTKITADGSSLIYSTFVGGTGNESGNAIAVDASGDAFVAGGTTSNPFPTTAGAFQTSLKGTENAFVFELDPTGSALTYSTYLGGTGQDVALGLALASDNSGDVYVVGTTSSTDFPPQNPLQATPAGGFVTKLNSTGTAPLLYSTYLGGGAGDIASAVAVDSSNNAYVTGKALNATFHTTTGAFQTTCASCSGGFPDAFLTVIKADGSSYVYSSFLGGTGSDVGDGIAVDSSGNAYIVGSTTSADFRTTTGAAQTTYGGNTDAFVTKLNPGGKGLTDLVYSTYLGGGLFDAGASIALDASNNAYVTGQTISTTPTPFPTASPTQAALAGGFDAFVSEINAAGSSLVFSTYLGGTQNEDISGNYGAIAVDSFGANVYVTGNTASTADFPTTLGSVQPTTGGGTDAFVVKYARAVPTFTIAATTPVAVNPGSPATSTVTLTAHNGYNLPVTLSCSVTGSGSPLPACSAASSFSPNPATFTAGVATSTLTITSSPGPLLSNMHAASTSHARTLFYALWLPIVGLSLAGVGFTSSRSHRKKLLGFLMLGMVMVALFLMPACGGSSSGGGGGGNCAAAPSAPTGLAASSTTGTGTTLNWAAATAGANCSVSGYTIYQGGKSIGTATNTTFNVTGLTASTMYTFTVAASDSAGLSAQSSPVNVTTTAGATPAGKYTITITGTDANHASQSTAVALTVN
jgi:Beta-propeller repeat/Fibronectin type III domain